MSHRILRSGEQLRQLCRTGTCESRGYISALQGVREFPHESDERFDILRLPRVEYLPAQALARGIHPVRHRFSLRRDRNFAHTAIDGVFLAFHEAERFQL